MLSVLRSLLDGYRGAPAADRAALIATITRVSALVEVVPELTDLDLNPVKVLAPGKGAIIVNHPDEVLRRGLRPDRCRRRSFSGVRCWGIAPRARARMQHTLQFGQRAAGAASNPEVPRRRRITGCNLPVPNAALSSTPCVGFFLCG